MRSQDRPRVGSFGCLTDDLVRIVRFETEQLRLPKRGDRTRSPFRVHTEREEGEPAPVDGCPPLAGPHRCGPVEQPSGSLPFASQTRKGRRILSGRLFQCQPPREASDIGDMEPAVTGYGPGAPELQVQMPEPIPWCCRITGLEGHQGNT
jgi:hypothetical protein